jgi:hypothetical protein
MARRPLLATLVALAVLIPTRSAVADVVDVQSAASVRSLAGGGDPAGGSDVTHDLGANLPAYADDLEVEPTKGERRARARSTLDVRVGAATDGITIRASGRTDIAAETNFDENFVGAGGNAGFFVSFALTEPASLSFSASGSVATAGQGESSESEITLSCSCDGESPDCQSFEIDVDAEDSPDRPPTASGGRNGKFGPGSCSLSGGTFSSLGTENQTSRTSFTVTLSAATISEPQDADEFTWIGGADGAFGAAENWDPSRVPTFVAGDRSDTAIFDGGPDTNVEFTDVPTLTTGAARASTSAGPRAVARSVGNLLVRNKRRVFSGPFLLVKGTRRDLFSLEIDNRGELALLGGGSLDVQSAIVGRRRSGTLTVGDLGSLFTNDFFFVGSHEVGGGDGVFRVDAGGLAHSFGQNPVGIGSKNGSSASVRGAGAEWLVDPPLRIGGFSSQKLRGTLEVRDGGHVDTKNGADVSLAGLAIVGGLAGTDSASWTADQILVGDGELDVLPGGVVSAGKVTVGSLDAEATVFTGRGLLVVDGGHLVATDVSVGGPDRAPGLLQIGGPRGIGGQLDVDGDIVVSSGDFVIQAIPQTDEPPSSENLAVTNGRLRILGGRLDTFADAAVGVGGGGRAELDVGLWNVLGTLGIGADDLSGTGVLRLLNGGTVVAGSILIGRFGRVEAGGGDALLKATTEDDFDGDGVIHNRGLIRAGIELIGTLEMGPDGVIEAVADGPAGTGQESAARDTTGVVASARAAKGPALPSVPLVVTGDATLGGTLVLEFRNGFAPKAGDRFDVLRATGGVTGDFAGVQIRGVDPASASFQGAVQNGALTMTSLTDAVAFPVVTLKAPKKVKETKKSVKITVQRQAKAATPLVVGYALGGTAENGIDYAALPGSVEIPAGKKVGIIQLQPLDDVLAEGSKTIEVRLLPGAGYSLPTAETVVIELQDNDVKKK